MFLWLAVTTVFSLAWVAVDTYATIKMTSRVWKDKSHEIPVELCPGNGSSDEPSACIASKIHHGSCGMTKPPFPCPASDLATLSTEHAILRRGDPFLVNLSGLTAPGWEWGIGFDGNYSNLPLFTNISISDGRCRFYEQANCRGKKTDAIAGKQVQVNQFCSGEQWAGRVASIKCCGGGKRYLWCDKNEKMPDDEGCEQKIWFWDYVEREYALKEIEIKKKLAKANKAAKDKAAKDKKAKDKKAKKQKAKEKAARKKAAKKDKAKAKEKKAKEEKAKQEKAQVAPAKQPNP
jgi:hypothetical protein